MKKVILTAIAVLGFVFANAQTTGFSKGDVFVSGAFNVGSQKTGDFKSSDFTLVPSAGYFVTENIAIGAKLGFSTSKEGDDKTNNFTVGAFGRYYFTPASQFSVYGQAGFDYMNSKEKPSDFKSNTIGGNIGLGMSYFLSNHFAIEATWIGLGYYVDNNGGHGAEKTNTFGFGTDLRDVSFGVVYKF
ncbi:outer membrane beta-barrel protein [Flavobacterium panici]|uniref:Porin family protein n=1 Tax=Flavobacterium panici TaxID=2654843 RepID=A0A9N8J0S3_9FLAO|nr:outer membrane beta-barrel protein [Flavobacterium panici]CAC9974125.1 porin family protein [Flavobacterium panici]